MIEPVCAYTSGHDHAYMCICVYAQLRLCVHAGMGMAYQCEHDGVYVCIYVQA